MKFTNKSIILDENIYKSLLKNKFTNDGIISQNVNPVVSQLSDLENKLQKILSNNQLDAEQKFLQYQQIFKIYQNALEEARKPVKVVLESNVGPVKEIGAANLIENIPVTTNSIEASTSDLYGEVPDFTHTLSVPQRKKAEKILEYLKGKVQWNTKEEILDGGKPVRGSKIRNIINFLVSDRTKDKPPKGIESINKHLKNIDENVFGKRGLEYYLDTEFTPNFSSSPNTSKNKSRSFNNSSKSTLFGSAIATPGSSSNFLNNTLKQSSPSKLKHSPIKKNQS